MTSCEAIAVRCAVVIRGSSRPLLVLVRSNNALASGLGLLMPTPWPDSCFPQMKNATRTSDAVSRTERGAVVV